MMHRSHDHYEIMRYLSPSQIRAKARAQHARDDPHTGGASGCAPRISARLPLRDPRLIGMRRRPSPIGLERAMGPERGIAVSASLNSIPTASDQHCAYPPATVAPHTWVAPYTPWRPERVGAKARLTSATTAAAPATVATSASASIVEQVGVTELEETPPGSRSGTANDAIIAHDNAIREALMWPPRPLGVHMRAPASRQVPPAAPPTLPNAEIVAGHSGGKDQEWDPGTRKGRENGKGKIAEDDNYKYKDNDDDNDN